MKILHRIEQNKNMFIDRIKENKNILINVIIGIYLYFSNIANHTVYSDISIILLLILGFICITKNKKKYFNMYFIVYGIFMLYQILLILFGVAINKNISISTLKTISVNLIILVAFYNIIIYTKNMKGFMKLYIIISAVSLATIMFIQRDNLFSGRLAHAYGKGSVSFYFLGKAIAISSNKIALFCAISVLFAMYIFYEEKDKKYLFINLFFILGIILTGSRKGILLLALYVIYIVNLFFKKSLPQKIIIGIIAITSITILITKVPIFYDIVGERLIELINNFLGKNVSEGSIVARERYTNYAFQWISNRPWMGYGIGAFKANYGNVTENNYLEMMVSGGIIGTAIYYSYLIVIIKQYIAIKPKDNIIKMLFFILISINIIEYGSVTYLSRNYLIFIVVFLAYAKIVANGSESRIYNLLTKKLFNIYNDFLAYIKTLKLKNGSESKIGRNNK